jgi:two-component system response regulator FixJ
MVDESSQIVAVVDDDEAVLDSFRFMLELAGFPVAVYPSALAFLNAGAARPRCLIVDQHMASMTGLELAAKLRADGVDVPVMLVTAAPSPTIRARAAEIGVRGVLEKPIHEDAVIAFIRSCDPV